MSDEQDDLYDESLPGESPQEEGRLLKYIIVGVLAILLYAAVTLVLTAQGVGI
jgi:putative flippase GtrA